MNNIQLVGDKYDMLSNCNIFVLDNSTCIKYDKLLFNVSGEIDGTQPEIKNSNLSLMINLQSEDVTETEVDCIINNTLENNYELNCKSMQALDMDLQSALSFMDSNNVLLINFGNVSESIINTEVENKNSKRLFFRKQSGGLKPGVIAAIVISLIVVLVAIISLVLYIRKQNLKSKNNSEDSTIRNISINI
jgi:hypothetical protein